MFHSGILALVTEIVHHLEIAVPHQTCQGFYVRVAKQVVGCRTQGGDTRSVVTHRLHGVITLIFVESSLCQSIGLNAVETLAEVCVLLTDPLG